MEYNCLQIITRTAQGGAEETTLNLVQQLARHNIYCDIAIGREYDVAYVEKFCLPPQCNIHIIPHLVAQPRPIFELLALRELRTLIRNNRYTIVQTHSSKAGILGRIAAHKEQVPVIIGTIHGISFPSCINIFLRSIYLWLERYAAKRSTSLVCVGEDIKQQYIQAKVGVREQYSVIYTGMMLRYFTAIAESSDQETQTRDARKQYSLPLDALIVGTIGRLDDNKNQIFLVDILPELLKKVPTIHLCIIGNGPNLHTIVQRAKELHVEEQVSFLGFVPEIWKVLPALDIHCMMSAREGLPKVLVQTSAAGIPNVCFEVDGAWEVIKNGVSGYIVDRGDTAAYIQNIITLANDNALRDVMGQRARKSVDTRWSMDVFGEKTKQLYCSLLSSEYH